MYISVDYSYIHNKAVEYNEDYGKSYSIKYVFKACQKRDDALDILKNLYKLNWEKCEDIQGN